MRGFYRTNIGWAVVLVAQVACGVGPSGPGQLQDTVDLDDVLIPRDSDAEGDVDSSDTDVLDTDPADADLPDTDVFDTDALDTDPADTDALDTDPADTDALDTDPPDTDGLDSDVAEPEPFVDVACGATRTPGCSEANTQLGTLRYIPPGNFTMGCVEGRDDDVPEGCLLDEFPSRSVTITQGFWMMESEMTQAAWDLLGLSNPSLYSGADRPVERVNWWEALEAANVASAEDGLPACFVLSGCTGAVGAGRTCTSVATTSPSGHPLDCVGWRLPTEAEWEYAARAGTDFAFSGSHDVDEVAWFGGNNVIAESMSVCTRPRPRSAWGLCDMSGNVWEWTWDWYDAYPSESSVDPVGPSTGSARIHRSGRWASSERAVRVANRHSRAPSYRTHALGLRLVRTAP